MRLPDGWHGDGGIRLTAPFSPALHLGASRILAISTRYAAGTVDDTDKRLHPPPMQIAGQLLDAVFLDDLDRDALNWNGSTGCSAQWRPRSGAACGRSSSS